LAGFTQVSWQEISNSLFVIKCFPPASHEDHAKSARRALTARWVGLKGVGLEVETPISLGNHLSIPLRIVPATYKEPKPVGRPRKDDFREKVRQLKADGKSWEQIRLLMNKKTGQDLTANAYRNLAKRGS
jgi:hypothetical protein